MNDITACNNKDCKRKNTCLRYITAQNRMRKPEHNYYSWATFTCDGQQEEYYIPVNNKNIDSHNSKVDEIYYVIKFDNGTFYNGNRYSCSKISNAKYYSRYEDAKKAKDNVTKMFASIDKKDLTISKIVINECEVKGE